MWRICSGAYLQGVHISLYNITYRCLSTSSLNSNNNNNTINSNSNNNKSNNTSVSLPPLRCPGGPRVKAEGLKQLFKVPHAGYLAKYDQRFILNLKLTHQIVTHLSRTTLRTGDKLLIELGPGVGALTRSLLTRPCVGVLGIETDTRFNQHLEQIRQYTDGKFQWVNGDVLQVHELDLLQALYPKFVEEHKRRPPTGGGNNYNNSKNNNSNSNNGSTSGNMNTASHQQEQEEGSSSSSNRYNDDGNSMGYEGAPLRNAQRERILRRRFGQNAGYNHDTASNNNSNSNNSNNNNESDRCFNPAFDVSDRWWSDGDAKVEVLANLPFDIITELLMRYAVDCSRRQNLFIFGRVPLHIFTQKEVADRIMAPAGSIHFSRLSVLSQCFFHAQVRQTFREMTYYPKTEVLGVMLTLQPRRVSLLPGIDASTLMHFTDLIMRPGRRGTAVLAALQRVVPAAVAQFILQELRIDGALTVLDLTAEEICKMADLWKRFLEASSQQQQQHQHQHQQQQQGGEEKKEI